MAGKHAGNLWQDLGVLRGLVAALGTVLSTVRRFLATAPEWVIGLLLTGIIVTVLLLLAG